MSDTTKKNPIITTVANDSGEELQLKVRRVRISTNAKAGLSVGPIVSIIPGISTW